MATLYYFHDPMCSWCWGYRPTAAQLFAHLPADVVRENVLGGLAPDSDAPMPHEQREAIASYWRRIEAMLGTKFNHDFWRHGEPRRSTYPACRAVIAATMQGREEEMIFAIQEAYYLHAKNPSDASTLEQIAAQLGLDTDKFKLDFCSADTEAELQRQIDFSRQSPISGFPSLVLDLGDDRIPIAVDYKDYKATLRDISRSMSGQ